MFSASAPARRRLLLTVLALVLAGVVAAAVAIAVHASGTDAPPPVAQGELGPVILVPGYGGSTVGLDELASTLQRAGRTAEVFPLPGDGRGDLDGQASALAAFAGRVRGTASTVDVVGYSAGGVVARLFVRDHGGDAFVRRVITLGSPQHGTDVAGLAGSLLPSACPTACRQLAPQSDLLQRLNAGDETPSGPTWVSIWTTADQVVVPSDSARLDGALNLTVQSVCAGSQVSHTDLPSDPQVAAIVVAELGRGAPAAPTSCVSS